MKIGLYLQASAGAIGGSEYWLSVLAFHLSVAHDVTVIHHKPQLTHARMSAHSGYDLSRVRDVQILPAPATCWPENERADLTMGSREYDVFIVITHLVPPLCAARVGVLILLFPIEPWWQMWPWSEDGALFDPRRIARRIKYGRAWRQRFHSYAVPTTLSHFAQRWARSWWSIDSDVLYPPNDVAFVRLAKQKRVLSVSRFTAGGVAKGQLELAGLFQEFVEPRHGDWEYCCVGTIGAEPGDRSYFEAVQASARGHHIRVEGDSTRANLKRLLAECTVFWHAAGFNVDEEKAPHLCEHFGIVTVEAMAAGAVPIVMRRGGQPEIVRHGVDGFTCDTLSEFATYTNRLIEDEALRTAMSASAKVRSAEFSEERSIARLRELVQARTGVSI